nr:hypothetical protein GCM10020241_55850 [Streptoalloteichus tenebrarius]
MAGQVMRAVCGSVDAVREAVTERLEPTNESVSVPIPFDGQSKKVVELTTREALRFGDPSIGAEHVLLAVLSLGEGTAVDVLHALGLTKERAETEVRRLRAS